MRRVEGRLVLSATDLTKHVACRHVTTLDLADLDPQPTLDAPVPDAPDDALDLVFAKGLAHERAYLQELERAGHRIETIDGFGNAAAGRTLAAMRAGAEVIYQACLGDGSWFGYADFLLRVDTPNEPTALGPWRYDIADTKLARRLTVAALLQMATYARPLTRLQGVPPRRLIVVTGDREQHAWAPRDVDAYARRVADRLETAVSSASDSATQSAPNPHCRQCRWAGHCQREWEARDDVGRVAGVHRDRRTALIEAGVGTLTQLAGMRPEQLGGVLSPGAARRVTHQARLQLAERTQGRPVYDLVPAEAGLGLAALPEPHPDDVYIDFEGNPWAAGGRGMEYLVGLLDREQRFSTWWAHDDEAEKALVEGLLDDLVARHRRSPGMHVYHYAAYERAALARMTARYGTREAEFDELLRAGAFVDLYAVVRQGLRISKGSYSIKKLEAFYWQHTRSAGDGEVADALSSVVEYERWLLSGEQAILDSIAEYNRQDVLSTLALHDWLEERRAELEASGRRLTRPQVAIEQPDPHSDGAVREAGEQRLAQRLREAGHPLAAACVGWHRREQRPAWWEYFRFGQLSTDDLVTDPKALGDLGEPEHVADVLDKRGRPASRVWRYPLPPQDYGGRPGDTLPCVDTLVGMGTLHAVDPVAGWAEFRRSARLEPVRTRAAGVAGPIDDQVLRASIQRTGEALLAGEATMGTRLLEPAVPPAAELAPRPGETASQVVGRVGRGLHGQVLAVQGPPGTGKTTAAAALIRALLDDGLRVGVTAQSHSVILHLLGQVKRPAWHKTSAARSSGQEVRLDGATRGEAPVEAGAHHVRAGAAATDGAGIRAARAPHTAAPTPASGVATPAAADPDAPGDASLVVGQSQPGTITDGLAQGQVQLVGGTAWLWAREEFAASVDVLVIDEAGQFSLANAVAVAPAATRGMVLLGDPQQLTQPTQAAHPDGGGVSALEHVLTVDGRLHDTVPPDRGVFLDRTWRMHPELAGFVSQLSYEERLLGTPGRERQRVDLPGGGRKGESALAGSGLVWMPVEHDGCSADSPVEARAVAALVNRLLTGTYTDHQGVTQPMTPADVLVVAPFNAHVARLRAVLPSGVRAGTVDKFQGRQAPVVVFSMASSSAELAPRGVSFLYDVHRLNVAISRARATAVVVCSPTLLDAPVGTPEQLRAVNALCRYVEQARTISIPTDADAVGAARA